MEEDESLTCNSCGEEEIEYEDHCIDCGEDICPSCSHCESSDHCIPCGDEEFGEQ